MSRPRCRYFTKVKTLIRDITGEENFYEYKYNYCSRFKRKLITYKCKNCNYYEKPV